MKLKKVECIFRRKNHLFFLRWRMKHKMTASDISVYTRHGPVQVMKYDIVLDYNVKKLLS